jgi:hypothetical protein
LDNLTILLCMCVGNAVAWLIALYSERGAYLLLWNVFFGTLGAVLCALAFLWLAPAFVIVGLVTAGPVCSLLMIVGGNAIRRATRA